MAKGSGTTKYVGSGSASAANKSSHNPPTYENTTLVGNFGNSFEKSYHIREKDGKYYLYYVTGKVEGTTGVYNRAFSKPYDSVAEAKLAGHKMYGMDLKDAILSSYSNAKATTETINAPSGKTTFYTNPLKEYKLGKDKVTTYIERSSGNTGYSFTEFVAKQGSKTIAHSQSESKLVSMVEDYLIKKHK
jgi:hypothetical protein